VSLRQPPALALWILRCFGRRFRGDSLEGDLFEEYQQGRTRAWYWWQALVAVALACRLASLPRIAGRAVLRLLVEFAVILCLVSLASQSTTWAGPSPPQPASSGSLR